MFVEFKMIHGDTQNFRQLHRYMYSHTAKQLFNTRSIFRIETEIKILAFLYLIRNCSVIFKSERGKVFFKFQND